MHNYCEFIDQHIFLEKWENQRETVLQEKELNSGFSTEVI